MKRCVCPNLWFIQTTDCIIVCIKHILFYLQDVVGDNQSTSPVAEFSSGQSYRGYRGKHSVFPSTSFDYYRKLTSVLYYLCTETATNSFTQITGIILTELTHYFKDHGPRISIFSNRLTALKVVFYLMSFHNLLE